MRRPHSDATRRGFTLVELLVVIAIIGVLVALLLPAVQAAREAARRSSCTNNLKQLGVGLHNHHDQKNTLPPGGVNTGGNGTRCYTNWAIEILPYIEQQPLYERYRQDLFNEDPVNRPVFQMRVATHDCPSDNLKGRLEEPASGPADTLNELFMHGSYRAVSGRTNITVGNGRWDTFEPNLWPGGVMGLNFRGPLHATGRPYNGIQFAPPGSTTFFPDIVAAGQQIKTLGDPHNFKDIIDGLSNTLMVGELTFKNTTRRATFWAYTYASYNQSSANIESSSLTNDYAKCAASPGNLRADQLCKAAFGSNHPGGTNFCMCDGSVRFMSYNVDTNLYCNSATIGNGEVATIQGQ